MYRGEPRDDEARDAGRRALTGQAWADQVARDQAAGHAAICPLCGKPVSNRHPGATVTHFTCLFDKLNS
jgi:hypothetical protein